MKEVKYPDLLAQIIKYCEPRPSAEEELQNCPLIYEYENSPESSPSLKLTPSEPTGILMLSLPSSDSVSQSSPHDNEEFETPPEHNNSNSQPYFSGSDELKPSTSTAAVDFQHNGDDTDAVNNDNSAAVDLGNDSDDLGFEERMRKRIRVSDEDLDLKSSVRRKDERGQIVIEIDQTQDVDTEVVIECEENVKVYERRIQRNADSSTVKMSERDDEEGDRGEKRENGERGVDDVEKLNGIGYVEMHLNGMKNGVSGGDGGGRGVDSMNLDEIEKLNGVCAKEMHSNGIAERVHGDGGGVGSVEGRRELPLSMRGGDKNVGLVEEVGRRVVKNTKFKDLVEAFSMVVGDVSGGDKNVDFFETAKARGLSFPRPRWWPPEGFSD
ncbi:PREDICTED: uncharacterized protein LOC109205317 [Nicotiana attenuata]|uniref:Uncharacterized protein n=1 Tax=Nicotiana attenuata TaxID=49451 RepID=A0A314KY85_NICAT|nr:PREDICTED: uncharacterized protein LOC109205317 [Nicotiana attenuata]OIT33977.1 hypothetical protein A4A49_35631 [Nicotiana attenuata]